MQYPVYYTLDQARVLLPFLEEKIRHVQRIHKALEFLSGIEIENQENDPKIDIMITKLNMNYYRQLFLYHKFVSEILTKGIVIKDLQKGLVDFYAKHQGRDIHLCWHIGEKDIFYWHELQAGFSGRQPIALLEENLP